VFIRARRMAALRFHGRDRQKWDNASFLARPTLPAIFAQLHAGRFEANWPCRAISKR